MADAIVVGSGTALSDRPALTVRLWPGRMPLRVVADRRGRVDLRSLFPDGNAVRIGADGETLREAMERLLADCGVGSVMVEGGAELLGAFICEGLFDEVRIERSPKKLGRGVAAPAIGCAPGVGITEVKNG